LAKRATISHQGWVLLHLIFEGTVFSGTGTGKQFIELPWIKQQIKEKLGFTPYSGTLNIHLTKLDTKKRKLLDAAEGFEVSQQAGYYPGVLFRASIDALACAVVVPMVPDYPNNVLEIIAPVYLRGKLGLTDGKTVTVAVTV